MLRESSGRLEYGLELAPGVSGEEVAIVCRGAFELREATAGALSIETSTGPLVRGVPAAWELDSAGTQRPS